MVSILTRMPMSFPGLITRDAQSAVIETEILTSTSAGIPTAFGQFTKTVAGKMYAFVSGDAATAITGILVRDFPNESISNSLGSPVPVAGQLVNRLRKGYCCMVVQYGTPVVDGAVYIRLDTGGNGGTVGGVEATADGTHSSAVTGARFTGSVDASGNAEVAYNE